MHRRNLLFLVSAFIPHKKEGPISQGTLAAPACCGLVRVVGRTSQVLFTDAQDTYMKSPQRKHGKHDVRVDALAAV